MSPEPEARPRSQAWIVVAVVLGGAAMLVPLYLFNPVEHSFFPRCFFHSLTGLDCPGCGGLRATHQLLHGHIMAALRLNLLFMLLLPVGAFFAGRRVWHWFTGRLLPQPFAWPKWGVVLAVSVIAFGVLRNLPWRAWFGV